jgi:hypothetical protein
MKEQLLHVGVQNCISGSWMATQICNLGYYMVFSSTWIFCFWYFQLAVLCEEWKCDDVVCYVDEEVMHIGCN